MIEDDPVIDKPPIPLSRSQTIGDVSQRVSYEPKHNCATKFSPNRRRVVSLMRKDGVSPSTISMIDDLDDQITIQKKTSNAHPKPKKKMKMHNNYFLGMESNT